MYVHLKQSWVWFFETKKFALCNWASEAATFYGQQLRFFFVNSDVHTGSVLFIFNVPDV